MRAMSDYIMMRRQECWKNPCRLCPQPLPSSSFLETVRAELRDKRPPECFFNTSVRPHACFTHACALLPHACTSVPQQRSSACNGMCARKGHERGQQKRVNGVCAARDCAVACLP
jgi:hypothetical protein